MKKILIGAVLASSLAMSGDLEKCSHAIDQANKYRNIGSKAGDNMTNNIMNKNLKSRYAKKMNAYYRLMHLWGKKVKTECKDVLERKDHDYFIKKFNYPY